ncbi:response regulator transcription factor [Actinorhabdospora filicis]|nr:response regulator transcription factor [Actinorhabdospora filicis]
MPLMTPSAARRADGGPACLLLVEDERMLADMLLDALAFAGYDVHHADTGDRALSLTARLRPDLLLLDVNLPGLDGFGVAARLRESGDGVPVIFLTARDTAADLRDGFLAGGDDYLTKPFRLEELRLRVEAVLRRTMPREPSGDRLAVADLVMDVVAHRVWRGTREVTLSRTEFGLLRYLMAHAGRVHSRAELLRGVWGQGFDSDTSLVETYISYLRRKVDDGPARLIHTVRGVGYALRAPGGEAP